ncbi:MAG: hypothetical protein J7578_10155, partial [Chitinophagaceae bacterium]|nr:hypothetical protein [Chitinophagaceae bacterium]
MRNLFQRFSFLSVLLISFNAWAGMDLPVMAVLDGARGQLKKDSLVRVEDAKFFDPAYNSKLIKPYQVKNMVSLEIDENSPFIIRSNFTVTVRLQITTTDAAEATHSMGKDFTIQYNGQGSYANRVTYLFDNAYRVDVKIISVDSGNVNWPVSNVLRVTNQLQSFPKYHFNCTDQAVQQVFRDPSVLPDTKLDELPVWWAPVTGADEYDLEWAYVDDVALADSVYGNPGAPDVDLIFVNNASRVTVSGSSYKIPLLYDNKGKLFFRVRSVQWSGDLGPEGGRVEANWSSGFTGGLGSLEFNGHEQTLNWQATTSFAEEGKRKSVVQYYDGSLRARQTVTRDNVTGNSIVTESMYDYQGRPVIQVLPVPTLKNAISYNRNFNRAMGGGDYDKSIYDTLADPSLFCNQAGLPMENSSGAARYYSPANDSAGSSSPIYRFIPDAEGFPFTEVVYTQDNTGRISRQSGVGPAFKIGSGHETRYYYSVPEQRELDALFGTDVGDRSHYFKTMVRDANGQFSVSYVDMTGKTIATALAGSRPDSSLQDLPSKNIHWMTERLSDAGSTSIDGLVMQSSRVLTVAEAGMQYFNYQLSPETLKLQGCEPKDFCYDCLYDLKITITDDCNNQNLGGEPYETVVRNFTIGAPDTSCNTPQGFNVSFSKYLPAGVYQVTKKLSLSQSSMDIYRDSFFIKRNLCKSLEDFIKEQRLILQSKTGSCTPTCQGCIDSLGTWEQFWLRYRTSAAIADSDTASYKVAAQTAYQKALDDCDILCDAPDELEAIRLAMLGDMTPPSGQYANIEKPDAPFSIFKDIPSIYSQATGYKDESGKPDSLWNPALQKLVPPSQLPSYEFVDNFKSSWAETLLPYHPEYCRYQKALLFKASYEYDRSIGKVDKYADAKAKGYLNPTNNPSAPFSFYNGIGTVQGDPFASVNSSQFKAQLENLLLNYRSNGTSNFSLWSVVGATVGCDKIDEDCLTRFGSAATLDTVSSLCEADRDRAWQTFRQLYLNIKRSLISNYLKGACTEPSVDYLFSQGYQPQFFDPADMIRQNNMPNPTNQQEGDNLYNEQNQKLQAQYDANCRAYIEIWIAQLSDCKLYSPAALKDTIIPKLLQVCKEGADVHHPMGASTVKPGSTYQYKSFEQVIDEYNQSRGITGNACNAYVITAPTPYGQQPGYTNKPVVSKPDTCECEAISNYHNKYIQVSESYTSFSDFMKKVYATDIQDSVLNALVALCNGEDICLFADIDVSLPPAFQCNTGEICIDCEKFKTLESEFQSRFPGVFPVADMTVRDSVQQSWNKLYEQFFNSKLGYVKDVSEYLAFANLCQGKWRSPGCDSLNRIIYDFRIDQQQNGPAADCTGAFRTLFNARMGTSFTSTQIDSIYFRTCGRGLEICGIRDSLLRWVAVYDSTRQKNYGVATSYAISDSTYTHLPGIVKNGVLQLPDAVRAVPSTTFSDINFKLNYGNYCWQSGYMMETRFKFLALPPNGDILRVDVGNLNCVFERTANGVHMKSLSDNQGMARNFGSGIGDTVNKLWDPSVMLDWIRIKVIVSPVRYYVYFNSTLIFDTVHNGVIANGSSIKISPAGRHGVLDWMKLTDLNNQVKYFEDFITPDRPAQPVKTFYCPTTPPDCKPGFASWYNLQRGTSLSFQQIDSVYLLFTGRSLNVCNLKDSLNNLVQQFNLERNPTRVQVATQSTNHPLPSPYYSINDPERIISDGYMQFVDTLRLINSIGYQYQHISTPTGVFCTANGYGVELRFKNLKNLVSGDLFYFQDANWKFTISNQFTGSKPGVYLGGFLERNSDSTRLSIPMSPFYVDNNPTGFSDNWNTLKLIVTKQKLVLYYNGNLIGEVSKRSSYPLLTFNVFTLAYRGYQGATDYVKMFNAFDEEMLYEEFNDRFTRSIIKPSFICPTPPVNCQSGFVTFFNQQRGTNYTYAKIDSLYYAMNGVRLDMCGSAPQPPPANYTLCGRAAILFPEVGVVPIDNCYDSTYFITSKARELYRIYLYSLKGYFDSSYKAKCLEAYKYEKFTVRRQVSEHHFTLYYYDQALS